jgi:molybdate transport repressor ModE-like protein
MSIDLRSVRLLLAVAESGSIGAAARMLGIQQPSATDRLQRLERQLGLQLLVRSPRGTTLTAAGAAVADWAGDVVAATDRLTAGVEALRAQHGTQLRVSASLTVAEYLVPRWLSQLRRRMPETSVALRMCNSTEVARDVLEGRADLGFVEGPHIPPDLSRAVVCTDELVLVVPQDHPWAHRGRPVTSSEVAEAPLVARERGSGTRDTLDLALQQAGVEGAAEPRLVLGSTAAIKAAVLAGQGIGVLSRLAIEEDPGHDLVPIPVEGLRLRRRLRMVWPRGTRLAGAADVLARFASGQG